MMTIVLSVNDLESALIDHIGHKIDGVNDHPLGWA